MGFDVGAMTSMLSGVGFGVTSRKREIVPPKRFSLPEFPSDARSPARRVRFAAAWGRCSVRSVRRPDREFPDRLQFSANVTPIRFSRRQTIRHGFRKLSLSTTRMKWSGNHKGLVISRAAPEAERLRTMHGTIVPLNSIAPPFNTRRLCAIRCSSVKPDAPKHAVMRRFATVVLTILGRCKPESGKRNYGAAHPLRESCPANPPGFRAAGTVRGSLKLDRSSSGARAVALAVDHGHLAHRDRLRERLIIETISR
jgi:hypothetical protein